MFLHYHAANMLRHYHMKVVFDHRIEESESFEDSPQLFHESAL